MPSCNKIATSALLYSCSTLKGSIEHDNSTLTRGSDLFVQEEINIYAARLAICELHGAEFDVEGACQPFIPTERTAKKTGLRGWLSQKGPSRSTPFFGYYDEITLANLDQCLKSLQTSAVAWMSYSNNRQNAIVMCEAMQSEVDRDEQIHIGKILATTAATASSSMQDVVEQIKDFQPAFNELRAAMPQFQRDLAAGNQQQLDLIQEIWANTERVLTSLQDVESGVVKVKDGIKDANEEIIDLKANLEKATDSSAAIYHRLTQTQAQAADLSTDIEATTEIAAYLAEVTMQGVAQDLTRITENVTLVNALMAQIRHNVASANEEQTLLHRDTMERNDEILKQQVDTLANIVEMSDRVSEMSETFSTMFAGLPGALECIKTGTAFIGSTVIYSLLSFAIWHSLGWLSALGTISASAATGIFLALYLDPMVLYRVIVTICAETVGDSQRLLGMSLGIVITAAVVAVWYPLNRAASRVAKRSQPYDPASPKFESGFEMPKRWVV